MRGAEYPFLAARSFEKLLRSKQGNALQRSETFRLLLTELVEKERLVTTLRKAKDLARVTERAIDVAKEGDKDLIYYWLKKKTLLPKVFDVLVPRYANVKEGYTKVYNLLPEKLNKAEMGLIELVGNDLPPILKPEEDLVKLQVESWKNEVKSGIPKEGTLV